MVNDYRVFNHQQGVGLPFDFLLMDNLNYFADHLEHQPSFFSQVLVFFLNQKLV